MPSMSEMVRSIPSALQEMSPIESIVLGVLGAGIAIGVGVALKGRCNKPKTNRELLNIALEEVPKHRSLPQALTYAIKGMQSTNASERLSSLQVFKMLVEAEYRPAYARAGEAATRSMGSTNASEQRESLRVFKALVTAEYRPIYATAGVAANLGSKNKDAYLLTKAIELFEVLVSKRCEAVYLNARDAAAAQSTNEDEHIRHCALRALCTLVPSSPASRAVAYAAARQGKTHEDVLIRMDSLKILKALVEADYEEARLEAPLAAEQCIPSPYAEERMQVLQVCQAWMTKYRTVSPEYARVLTVARIGMKSSHGIERIDALWLFKHFVVFSYGVAYLEARRAADQARRSEDPEEVVAATRILDKLGERGIDQSKDNKDDYKNLGSIRVNVS